MRWYEYKMEVDDLHASDDLKAKLLAMQPAEEAPKPARKPKKAIHFPRKTLSIAACGLLCGVGLYAAVHSPSACCLRAARPSALPLRRPPTPPPTRWTT